MVVVNPSNSTSGDNMEWSADGENTDYSTTSSSPTNSRRQQLNQDQDSFSEEDDLSDEFSLVDSDEEKQRSETRCPQHMLQVGFDIVPPCFKSYIHNAKT